MHSHDPHRPLSSKDILNLRIGSLISDGPKALEATTADMWIPINRTSVRHAESRVASEEAEYRRIQPVGSDDLYDIHIVKLRDRVASPGLHPYQFWVVGIFRADERDSVVRALVRVDYVCDIERGRECEARSVSYKALELSESQLAQSGRADMAELAVMFRALEVYLAGFEPKWRVNQDEPQELLFERMPGWNHLRLPPGSDTRRG